MSIRNLLNRNRPVVIVAAVIMIVGAGAYGFQAMRPTKMPPPPNRFYYIDEDKTAFEDCFAAPRDLIPPFDHNGKQAVRARVFEVSGKPTVVFMEKTSPELKTTLEKRKAELAAGAGKATAASISIEAQMRMSAAAMLLKRPTDKNWVRYIEKPAQAIARPPDGPDGMAAPEVLPGNE